MKTVSVEKKNIDELIKECSENIDRNEMIWNRTLNANLMNDYEKLCNSFTIYII